MRFPEASAAVAHSYRQADRLPDVHQFLQSHPHRLPGTRHPRAIHAKRLDNYSNASMLTIMGSNFPTFLLCCLANNSHRRCSKNMSWKPACVSGAIRVRSSPQKIQQDEKVELQKAIGRRSWIRPRIRKTLTNSAHFNQILSKLITCKWLCKFMNIYATQMRMTQRTSLT